MYRLILVLLLLCLSPLAMAASVSMGVITQLEGQVQLLRDRAFYEAGIGTEIFRTDAVTTGSDGLVQLDMVDGAGLRIGADSRLRFSEYEFDDKGNVVSAAVDVLAGWVRFAVSKLQENKDGASQADVEESPFSSAQVACREGGGASPLLAGQPGGPGRGQTPTTQTPLEAPLVAATANDEVAENATKEEFRLDAGSCE